MSVSTSPNSPMTALFQSDTNRDAEVISSSPLYELTKRVLDIASALTLLTFLAPVMAVVAVLIKTKSPGPVIFRQDRLGRYGRVFRCYKFRTMAQDAESRLIQSPELLRAFDETFKIKDDPRVTPLGKFLRKTSLDELPQIFNVLGGSMSLIGPRPIVPREAAKYGAHAGKLLTVKPGLGGYWQVYGRSDTSYDQRVMMDMTYVDSRSLTLDLKLVALTAWTVLLRRGAY